MDSCCWFIDFTHQSIVFRNGYCLNLFSTEKREIYGYLFYLKLFSVNPLLA